MTLPLAAQRLTNYCGTYCEIHDGYITIYTSELFSYYPTNNLPEYLFTCARTHIGIAMRDGCVVECYRHGIPCSNGELHPRMYRELYRYDAMNARFDVMSCRACYMPNIYLLGSSIKLRDIKGERLLFETRLSLGEFMRRILECKESQSTYCVACGVTIAPTRVCSTCREQLAKLVSAYWVITHIHDIHDVSRIIRTLYLRIRLGITSKSS